MQKRRFLACFYIFLVVRVMWLQTSNLNGFFFFWIPENILSKEIKSQSAIFIWVKHGVMLNLSLRLNIPFGGLLCEVKKTRTGLCYHTRRGRKGMQPVSDVCNPFPIMGIFIFSLVGNTAFFCRVSCWPPMVSDRSAFIPWRYCTKYKSSSLVLAQLELPVF